MIGEGPASSIPPRQSEGVEGEPMCMAFAQVDQLLANCLA